MDTADPAVSLTDPIQFENLEVSQKIINKHLETATEALVAFLALAPPAFDHSDPGWTVSIIGERILPTPVQLWGVWNPFPPLNESHPAWMRRNDLQNDSLQELENLVGCETTDCMLVPVRQPTGEGPVLLLVVLVNKTDGSCFDSSDLNAVHRCFPVPVLARLVSAIELERERHLREQCQKLLNIAENLFSHLDDVEKLLRKIMNEARRLTRAERCSFFLLEKELNSRTPRLVAKVFEAGPSTSSSTSSSPVQPVTTAAVASLSSQPADYVIAGRVAATGRLVNIHDPDVGVMKTRNVLCFPIRDEENAVLGIVELANKTAGDGFTRSDEQLVAGKFATFCGIALVQALRYKKVRDAQHRSHLSNELMMYHMKVTNEEVSKVLLEEALVLDSVDDGSSPLSEFYFVPRSMDEFRTPAAVVAVFNDLGLKERWSINKETLSRFVLMVRKGYRDPPYHNWMHAFSVFHFSYLIIKRLRLVELGYLTDLESLALLVSSLCHDVDHRGTTNSFQLASNSVLAALYSSEGSVMERHHFAQTMCILNTDSCNIFENLSSNDYTRCLDLMQDLILATDLAHHLRIFCKLRDMVESGYDAGRPEHHQLLLYLIMTAADLSDQTKDWKSSRNAALLVYREFFSQGDLEKAMGNRPVEMMDRDKACIPSLQIQFIDDVALPVYTLLAQLFPEVKLLVDNVNSNRQHWVTLEDGHIVSPMEILTNDID